MTDYGWLSILPPLTSLGLALYTRKVLLSLACGVFIGGLILSGGNPLSAILFVIEKELFVQIGKPFNSQIILLMILINGFVALIEGSGAIFAFGRYVNRSIRGPVQTQLATWMGGLAIFFTDSGNSLILGPIFQPLYRQVKICKEKLAYILDSTASPICVMIPFIGWGIYSISLIQGSFESLGIPDDPFFTFIKVIPFQFYPILALLTVPTIILSKRNFSLMNQFQKRYEQSLAPDSSSPVEKRTGGEGEASASTVLIPMAVLFVLMIAGFLYFYLTLGKLPGSKIRVTLMIAYVLATTACGYLINKNSAGNRKNLSALYLKGVTRIAPVLAIIIFAWSLGDICNQVGTGKYLGGFIQSGIPIYLFPALVFLLGGVMSFATGSAWGTFGIMMPIALPIAHDIGAPMLLTIGAVLSSGLFGDHCSPISDTTILASMGADCKHADHVNSQIPYALTTATCALFAFVIAGMTKATWVLGISILLLFPVAFTFQKIEKAVRNAFQR